MLNDSDYVPLECQPRLRPPRLWRRRAETVAMLMCLIGGGFVMGVFYGVRQADDDVRQLRDAHVAELERLTKVWESNLKVLGGRIAVAADTSAAAAQVAGEAAQVAGEAASTAQTAATTAAKAAKEAKK